VKRKIADVRQALARFGPDPLPNFQSGTHRALAMILVAGGNPEKDHHPVRSELVDRAAVSFDDFGHIDSKPADDLLDLLCWKPFDEPGITGKARRNHACFPSFTARKDLSRRWRIARGMRPGNHGVPCPLRSFTLERGQECLRRRVPLLPIFCHRLGNSVAQAVRNIRVAGQRRKRLTKEDGLADVLVIIALKRVTAGHHLVADDSERPDVGSGVNRFASELFRAHVPQCSERGSRSCQ
jgi:hypothetical protein